MLQLIVRTSSGIIQWVGEEHSSRLLTRKGIDNCLIVDGNIFVDEQQEQSIQPLLTHGASQLALYVSQGRDAALDCICGDRGHQHDR